MENDKRQNYISWDMYFMGLAMMASFRSKDPSTQNGACLVDMQTKNILSMGYNGFPRGCSDDAFPWGRNSEDPNGTKYPYVEHAERNAIYNAVLNGISLKNSCMYLYSEKGYYPCSDCARAIIQSGIGTVVMAFAIKDNTDKYDWTPTKKMFESSGVKICILSDLSGDFMSSDAKLLCDKFNEISEKITKEKNNG